MPPVLPARLQEVESAAARAFASGPASAADLEELGRLLAAVTLDDLGLAADLAAVAGGGAGTPWVERILFARPELHASVFLVPAGAELPLHDHPEMTVLLRPLAGRLEIAAFDRIGPDPADPSGNDGALLARPRGTREVGPDDPCDALTPENGNLHRIRAREAAAFLDLFSPYYAEDEGRPCSYYREEGEVVLGGERLVRLALAPELDPERRA